MRTFRDLSIRRKQTLIIMLTSTVSLLLACAAFVAYDVSQFRTGMVESVSSLAQVVGNNTTAAIDFDDPLDAAQTLAALRGEPSIVLARVHTLDGQAFATYVREGAPLPELPQSLETRHEFIANQLHLFRPITQGGEQVGVIEVVANLDELRERLWRYAGIAGLVLAAALLAAFWLSSRLQKVISDPILHLAQVARSVAREKNYSVRATKQSTDELGQLVDGFNEMLGQIQERDEALQAARDQLEQRVAERTQELRQTEAIYRSAIAGAGAVPYSNNSKTRSYVFMGEGIQQLIGYAPHEVNGALWGKIIQESVMLGEAAGLDKTEAARRVARGELLQWRHDMRVTTRDGKSRWLSDAAVQILDEAGQVTGSVGILQDVTERKQAEITALAFSKLGRNLSSVVSRGDAAKVISEAADELFGWDAAWVQLYSEKDDTVQNVFDVDTLDGQRIYDSTDKPRRTTELHRRILTRGGELILRDTEGFLPDMVAFGDKSRPSASLMFVPIRAGTEAVGILSIQSYSPQAYTEQDLARLQMLADQCGGALARISADEARRDSESQFRLVWNSSADGLRLTDREGTVLMVNDAYCRMTGKSKAEVEGRPLSVIHQEKNVPFVMRSYRQRMESHLMEAHVEVEVPLWNGKTVWFELSNSFLELPGQPVLLLSIFRDITERKRAEVSALAFSKLGRNLSAAASREAAARIISEVADELFGWDAAWVQLYSKTDDTVQNVYDVDTVGGERIYATQIEPRRTTELHRRILTRGGELILRDTEGFLPGMVAFGDKSRPSASLMFVPIRAGTEAVGILSIQSYSPQAYTEQDLARLQTLADQCGGALARIRADEARRDSESQFRLVWNSSADGMRLTNREGVVLMVNDAYCRMTGKSKAEVEGQPLTVIHCVENAEQVMHAHQERMDSGATQWNVEAEVTLWNERTVWFELSNSILSLPGQPLLLLSIFRDITERKAAEAELETMHKQLMDASRRGGMAEIATNVLHNVGNVLNSVNISTGLIVESVKKSRASSLARVVALLREHAQDLGTFITHDANGKHLPAHLAQLSEHLTADQAAIGGELESLRRNVEHIKEIVSMQQNYATVGGVKEVINVVHLAEDSLRMNEGALSRHGVEIIREFASVPPINVEKHKILQILVNLVRNAKYACDESERADKRLTMRVSSNDGLLRISVTDNGVGIAPENLTRIFSHGFTTRKGGHGFGLHSGALAAREMGGSLTVHSDGPGKGAVFTLELPAITQVGKKTL